MTARKELRASHFGNPDRAPNVLIVDDESGVRGLMARWLEAGGYRVTTAGSAEEAIGRLEETVPAVALCDIRMPGHDGLWLAERIRQEYPETAVIMATGVQDVAPAVKTLRQGVIDYLTKPLSRDRVREAVTRGLEWHEAAWDARRWREALDQEVMIRRSRLSQALAGIVVDSDDMVDSMFAMVTLTAAEMHGHGYRVAAMAVRIARMLGLPDEALGTIEHGALLHDVGKLTLPDAILRKPAPLTAEELMLVRRHPTIGSELVASVPYLHAAVPIVREAHERMDGLGYPHGVHASELSIGARIVSVADAYDTMTRPRVFRDALDPSAARLELERCSGTQFDPLVVEAFRSVFRDIWTC
jgi:response regulator RpfG family c-di-GMP phosphodiesterase